MADVMARRKVKQPQFDAAWNRRRRRATAWRRWRWRVGLALVLAAAALARWLPERSGGEWVRVSERFVICGSGGSRACVVDGDTVRIGPRRIRLAGFDAPELAGACPAEQARAREARASLLVWLGEGPFEWDGGTNPPRDQHGRELRHARRGGEALAEAMVARGLAEGSGWDRERMAWC